MNSINTSMVSGSIIVVCFLFLFRCFIRHRYLQSDKHSSAYLPGGDIGLCLPILLGPPGDDHPHVRRDPRNHNPISSTNQQTHTYIHTYILTITCIRESINRITLLLLFFFSQYRDLSRTVCVLL